METRASWNGYSKLQVPKRRGMILEPDHETVISLTPEVEEEAGAGTTETEAPESTKKWREDSLSKPEKSL